MKGFNLLSYRSLSIQSRSIAVEAGKRKLALIELVAYDPNVVAGAAGGRGSRGWHYDNEKLRLRAT